MWISFALSWQIGVLVGLTFRVMALVPIVVVAAALSVLRAWQQGAEALYLAGLAGLVVIGVQLGYLCGAALSGFIRRKLHKEEWKNSVEKTNL
jgi:hypothetical protein